MSNHYFVVCVNNDDYATSLEPRKLYEVLPDEDAAKHGQVRIIDESGEDYLYPESFFAPVELPTLTEERILRVA
ncbi:MAG: hypothetical protein D4R70_01685 [Betaproteobacteria bacterium]|nr:MAG: hypothetical protein D4R70_01685 [Betaproteobacteria bacterium]